MDKTAKQVFNEYKKNIKYFLENKKYIISIIVISILAYGFYITNYSIGVDDFSQDRYVTGTYLLSQGRWGNVLLARIFNIVEFTPFWTEFVAVILLIFMSILLSAFIRKEIGDKVNKTIYYILFSGLIISYPIIHHIFLYNFANVITLVSSIGMIIISIIIYENINELKDKKMSILLCCIAMPFFISMYEASCQTFLVVIFMTAFVRLCKNNKGAKEILKYIIICIGVLAISIILNSLINIILKRILAIQGSLTPDFSGRYTPWTEYSIVSCLKMLKNNIIDIYHNDIKSLYYILVFFIVGVIAILKSIRQSIKEKNIMYSILIILIFIVNFAINIIQIRVLYRTSASWSITIAFMTLYILISIKNNDYMRKVIILIISFIILCNSKTLTQLFYNEHVRFEREKNIAYDIANTILRTCENPNKPLIFVPYNIGEIQGNSINIDNGWSVIGWGIWAFGENGTETVKFINSLGYNFNYAEEDEYKEGYEEFLEIKDNHKKDFIIELDKYIIVKVIYEPR